MAIRANPRILEPTVIGPFLDWLNLQAGTTDGRYAFDFWARSVGRDNQSYNLDAAAIGYHYLSVGWDQTPHLISTSAKSIFGGAGTTVLTVANPVQAALQAELPNAALAAPSAASGVLGQSARANIENIINSNVGPLVLGTQRDKATAAYRSTPTPDWDLGVDYSHEHRSGTRPIAVPYGRAPARARVRLTPSRFRSRSTTRPRTSMPRPSMSARPGGARGGRRM